MEKVADLVDAGGGGETEVLSNLPSALDSYLDEQKEKPSGIGIIDSDILELANQVGDEIDNSGDTTNIDSELSFLEGAEAKETSEMEDDPNLAFLVGESKVEIDEGDLSFLEQQEFESDSEYEEGSEGEEESEEDEEEENEEESGEEEDTDEKMEEEGERKGVEKQEDDETVFGQVSFYDEEPEPKGSVDELKTSESKTAVDNFGNEKKKITKKKKIKTKKRKADDRNEDASEKPPAKKKRKKKRQKKSKAEGEDDGDEEEEEETALKGGTSQMRRKNIRSILSEKDLDKEMLSAQNEELERQKRLMELKKTILKENAAAVGTTTMTSASTATTTYEETVTTKTASASTETPFPKEKDSQLKSLLQVAEEEAEKEAESKDRKQQEIMKAKKETKETSPPSDVITLSSDSDDSEDLDDEDSDGIMVVPSDEDEDDDDEGAQDANNGGSHIDDSFNLPDPDGRVKINMGHPPDDPDIYLAPQIAQAIRPHQIGGVRFLYDNLIESFERFKTSPGFGCILAHSMGLGKTIQLISFIDIFIRCTGGKRVLCIVPINTLQNWLAEFNYWLPEKEKLLPDDDLTQHRVFPLYLINDSMKTTAARASAIEKWKSNGGVLIMGYEMFRLLSSKRVAPTKKSKSKAKKSTQPEVIDVEEEDKNKSLMIDMHSTLVDPGPDLVMCDEGHRIKNSSAAISQALKNIKTRRRVVLTGYPLQNNLMEYWCMVDFVRPSFLGTKTEFSNMFERPIMNGQCMDSTAQDKKIMRHRSYVLHNLLEGFVQRRGHTVLKLTLPPKSENVFLIRLSPIQRKIYCEFMNAISESGLCSWANNNPLKAFAVCCKIWNHPDVLHEVLTQHIADKDNDLDIDTGEGKPGRKKTSLKKSPSSTSIASTASFSSMGTPAPLTPSSSTTSLTSMASENVSDKNPITYDWAENVMKDYIPGILENSGKLVLMKSLIEECLGVGDKVLVFSQSLLTLNKIEEFFGKLRVPRPELNENWSRNRTYFRLDGSTSAQDREKLINQFNDPDGCAWLFLLSTKAGCLGINLVGANRVIVVDASWNPCHDCQAVCRVYRFGQCKSSYVYRLVTDNTLEKRIYDRQISKQGMSDRIVDDMNIVNKFTRRQVENLLDFEDQDFPFQDFSNAETKYGTDPVLIKVLKKQGNWLTKQPFTHESLLIDHKEFKLSKREKRLAKEGYARDKRMNVTYTRPSYAAYYPQQGAFNSRLPLNNSYAAFRRGPIVRPIASVRPIISASAQNGAEKIKQFGGQPLRPGVTIHQVITTTEILLPGTNTGTQAGANNNKIGAGQKILVIKTPKGVYIRTNDGKMFAVRSKGAGIGLDIGNNSQGAIATTTTTLSTSGGNQVFISPGINMSSAAGGKKPPIIIVSNKKGMPLSMARGGSIIRTLPYGSANLISNLRPNILKANTVPKSGDTTSTTSSTSLKPSPSVLDESKGPITLSDLIGEGNSDNSLNNDGLLKSTAEGGTQSGPPKMPVIVLPSLAVRTPRPPSKQPSPSTTCVGSGSTVVIMPTKPVISMGTKRPTKNSKKKNKGKESIGVGVGTDMMDDKKRGTFSLLSANSRMPNGPSGNMIKGGSQGTQSNTDSSSAVDSQSAPLSQTSQLQRQGTPMGQMPPNNFQQNNQSSSSAFPDLNHMWQANFGSAPPTGGPPTSMNQTSSMANMPSAAPPSGTGFPNNNMAHSSMMPNMGSTINGTTDTSVLGSGPDMNAQNNSNQMNSSQSSSMPGGISNNPQQGMSGFSNPGFNNGTSNNPSSTSGGNMGNPFMSSNNMNPYSMGNMMQGGPNMNPYMPSGMNPPNMNYIQPFNSGGMGSSNMPMQNQPQPPPQSGNNSMMYGSSSNPLPPSAPFGSSSYGMNNNQQNSAPPPYGSSGAPAGSGQYHNQPGGNPAASFGFQSSSMNYRSSPTSSSFPPQPMTDQQNFTSTASSQPGPPPPPIFSSHQQQEFNMDQLSNTGNASNSTGQTQFPGQHNQQQPQQQQNHSLQQPSRSASSTPSSMTPTTLSIPSFQASNIGTVDKRDSSPYSLTLLGSDTSSTVTYSSSKSKRSKGSSSSKSSKTSSSSSVPHARDSPNVNKIAKSIHNTTLSIPDPSSPRNTTATPDRSKPNNLSSLPDYPSTGRSNDGLSHLSPNASLSNSSSLNIPSLTNPLTNLPAFRPLSSSPVTENPANSSQFGSESSLGGSAFRAHPGSSFSNLPANPHPFRLDGAGGISGMPTASGLNYNSEMSAFSSPVTNVGGAYGTHNAFGAYSSGYANPGALPFSSSPMMPPQPMMGYPQTGLSYPSMSSLMMGAPPPSAPSPMGSSMWPMMPPSMMGGAYGYPPHPSTMGFSTPGFDSQGFGN